MTFLWPDNLWSMLVLPLLPLLYLWLLRRAGKPALKLSSPERRARRRRSALAAARAAGAGVGGPGAAAAGPGAPDRARDTAGAKSTILLAIDISRSMRVQDVKPTRMVAAQDAAKAFLGDGAAPHRRGPGHLRRHGPGGAGSHAGPPVGGRRDRRHPDAVRHRHRQRHRGVPGRTVPRPRHRPGSDDLRSTPRGAQPGRRTARRSCRRSRSRRWRRAPTTRPRSSC
jgi:hypothetical protein